MSSFPTKRQKLAHDSASPDGSESEGNGPKQQSPPGNSTEATAPPKSTTTKRTRDGDDGALYSGGLYRSVLFKLQIDELLREVVPNYEKRFSGLNEALHKLKSVIEGIQERDALPVSD